MPAFNKKCQIKFPSLATLRSKSSNYPHKDTEIAGKFKLLKPLEKDVSRKVPENAKQVTEKYLFAAIGECQQRQLIILKRQLFMQS